ncbi:hypothetical protein QFC19_003323 [Naganishia cerealis]|uniref:Uncharacterized protein n=1 Tax=Naganishia cerealis TaxID=610337 RepID=A0ACC2W3F9_9TREE|nr:hypothetical protein QFC19_003323 [Naganishia cerealis]
MTLSFAVAQTCPLDGPRTFSSEQRHAHDFDVFASIAQNLATISKAAEDAHANGSDLVIFPEYYTQGSLDAIRLDIAIAGTIVELEDVSASSQPNLSPFPTSDNEQQEQKTSRDAWAQHVARMYPETFNSTHPSSTTHQRSNDEKDLPHDESTATPEATSRNLLNVAYFIQGGTGEVIGRYVKKNLWISERQRVSPPGVRRTCPQTLAKQGVDLIIAPTYWLATDSQPSSKAYDPPEDYEYQLLQALCYSRAFETETVLAMCNAGGDDARGLMGGSGVWMPFKGKLHGEEYASKTTSLCFYDLDLSLLAVARNTYKIREDWKTLPLERQA